MRQNIGHTLVSISLQDKKDPKDSDKTLRFLGTPEDAWELGYMLKATHTATLRNLRGSVLDTDKGLPELLSQVYL
jgi:hypothetical protein